MGNKIFFSTVIMFILSALVASYYFYIQKYRFVGKIYGGIIVAFLGAMLFNIILEPVFDFFKNNFALNILSVIIGAYVFIKILRKVTP